MNKHPTFELEYNLIDKGFVPCGVDEVGRGVLCGPVVAAAVVVPEEAVSKLLGKVKDSKKLSKKKRQEYNELILTTCDCSIYEVSNDYVDEYNILEATKVAMQKALQGIVFCDYALIDGNMTFDMSIPYESVIKGDNKSLSIACASIIAKVYRDNLMLALHKKYPMYGFDTNSGYGTKKHKDAIVKFGITKYHRKTFRGVFEYV